MLKPGVVYGDTFTALVGACKRGGYALPAVNVTGTHAINAVLEAAHENKSDVILQLSSGGGEFVAGRGCPSEKANVLGCVAAAHHVHTLAEYYGVCCVLHTDHAPRSLLPWVYGLLQEGRRYFDLHGRPLFTSHMLDLSAESVSDNLAESARLLEKMAPLGMSLEIELGITGGEEDGVGSDDDVENNPRLYTQPQDVLEAYKRLSPLGSFSVAASFGNVHGVYKPGNVKLRPSLLKHAQELVQRTCHTENNPLHFVFHGGSGSEKEKIKEAVSYGVFKMNIDTDTQFAFSSGVGAYVRAHEKAFLYQIDPEDGTPYKKQYDPRMFLRSGEKAMAKRLKEAFEDLGSVGRSLALS